MRLIRLLMRRGWYVDLEDIQKVFVDYFSGIFTTKSNLEMEKTLGAVERRMIDEMLSTLSQPFTEEDVTKALF